MKDISSAFTDAETLLRKYGYAKQADLVHAGLAAVRAEGEPGFAKLATQDWWGGSDSVADVYLHREGESFTVGQEKDNRALRAALLSIHQAMQAAGLRFDKAEVWANAFTKWRPNDV
jgi:hypothetical protein